MKMKVAILLMSMMVWTSGLHAQEWAPLGATWHYHHYIQGFPPYEGYVRFEAVTDTVINGQPTRKILANNDQSSFYMHAADGVAWVYVPSAEAFDTLFNFNAIPGDHWQMVPLPEPLWCTAESWVEVVDTGSTVVSDHSLRWLAVNYHNLQDDGFEAVLPDTIVERLGPMDVFMLPQEQCNTWVSPGSIFGLFCYADAEVTFQSPSVVDCQLGMGLAAEAISPDVRLYPNPGLDGFTLSMSVGSLGLIAVYDARGAQVHDSGPIATSIRVDTSDWPSGLYSIHVLDDRGRLARTQWVKL